MMIPYPWTFCRLTAHLQIASALEPFLVAFCKRLKSVEVHKMSSTECFRSMPETALTHNDQVSYHQTTAVGLCNYFWESRGYCFGPKVSLKPESAIYLSKK